jgi:hypothetical protein
MEYNALRHLQLIAELGQRNGFQSVVHAVVRVAFSAETKFVATESAFRPVLAPNVFQKSV